MKPFDFEAAMKGAKVCTRDGRKVKITVIHVSTVQEEHPWYV